MIFIKAISRLAKSNGRRRTNKSCIRIIFYGKTTEDKGSALARREMDKVVRTGGETGKSFLVLRPVESRCFLLIGCPYVGFSYLCSSFE